MATEVDIFNMALGHISAKNTITSAEEVSKPATECRRFYATARDTVLEAIDWPFARRWVTLAELGTPPPGWIYQYAYPAACVRVREIVPYVEAGTVIRGPNVEPIPFEIAHSDVGDQKVILTDEQAASARYTKRVTNTTMYSASFVEALAARLAAFIAKPLTGKTENMDTAMSLYNLLIGQAMANAKNERQKDNSVDEHDAPWIKARS